MTGDSKTESAAQRPPLPATLEPWWKLGLSVATTLVAVLASLGLGKLGQAIALAVAATAFAVTVFLLHRHRSRKVVLTDRIQAYRHWRERASDSAFRGLYAFGRADVLPGVERRRSATALATWVKSDRFRFGVISGEVGCGKTSFVNAVASLLEGSGFKVLVCEGFHGLQQAANGSGADPGVGQVLSGLREASSAKAGSDPFILIIDQFEEFLIRYVLPGERQQLGNFLNQPISGAEAKVICAVRSDYLLEMHDLAPALPEPLSTKSLVRLRYFSVEEAEEVILECAERDGIPIDKEFATLITHDLSHGSLVRPAELQVVCSALTANPSVEAYRAGGAAAILSEYIQTAIEISVDPQLARVVLRAFCAFDTLPPSKAKPRTQAEIVEALGLDLPGQHRLGQILESLEKSRLITSLSNREHEAMRYALVHDDDVGLVAAATGGLRTPTEAADQDLRGFLFQFRTDPKTRIPRRKIAPLENSASTTLLRSTEAVVLLRRSKRFHLIRAGLIALALGLAAGTVWTISASSPRWERVVVDRMIPGSAVRSFMSFSPLADRFVLGEVHTTSRRISLWDARTGRSLVRDSSFAVSISPRNELLLKAPLHGSVANIVDLIHGTSVTTPFSVDTSQGEGLDRLAGVAFLSEKLLMEYGSVSTDLSTTTARVWSLPDRKLIGRLANVDLWHGLPERVRLLRHADRLILLAERNQHRVPFVWTIHRQRDMGQLRPLISSPENDVVPGEVAVNEHETALVAIERRNDRWSQVCIWNLPLEKLVVCRDFSAPGFNARADHLLISLSVDGQYAYVTANTIDGPALVQVYDTEDMLAPIGGPLRNTMIASAFSSPDSGFVAVWEGPADSARYWRDSDHRRSTLPNFSVRNVHRMQLSADGKLLLVTRRNGQVELWDLTRNSLIRRLQQAGHLAEASFTMDRRTIAVYSEGGEFTFYDGESGNVLTSLPIGTPAVSIQQGSTILTQPLIYRDAECQRYHVWTPEGLVLRYQRGRNLPFRGFVPSRRAPRCR
jgi:hypothetical protein